MTMSIHKLGKLLGSIVDVFAKGHSIVRTENGFLIHDRGRTLAVQFLDVVAVEGTKVNKVTYDEDYLVLTKANGEKIAIGELTSGFVEFEQAIYASLKGFPREWRTSVEKAQADEAVALWTATP